jgi:hypothetical protein
MNLVAHLYLIMTRRTVLSNLKAMITGYEELTDEEDERTAATASLPTVLPNE